MIRFRTQPEDSSRGTVLVGLGLEEENLVRLLAGRPIAVPGCDLGLLGSDFAIVAGKDAAEARARAEAYVDGLQTIGPFDPGRVRGLHVNDTLWVIVVPHDFGLIYVIGLDDVSCALLRAGRMLAFRARVQDPAGNEVRNAVATGVEVLLFHGKDAAAMEQGFREAGLIGPGTRVDRPDPPRATEGAMTDDEWAAWRAEEGHGQWLILIAAHLIAEMMRHADMLGALIVPRRNALAYLRDTYPKDPVGFHERVADYLIEHLDVLKTNPLAHLYFGIWQQKEAERVARGEPCPCMYCRTRTRNRKDGGA